MGGWGAPPLPSSKALAVADGVDATAIELVRLLWGWVCRPGPKQQRNSHYCRQHDGLRDPKTRQCWAVVPTERLPVPRG